MSKEQDSTFELCKEVYKINGWKTEKVYINDDDNLGAVDISYWETVDGEWGSCRKIVYDLNSEENDDTEVLVIAPLYTSDYLLEKLPKELHKNGMIHYLTLSSKYGDEFKANYITPTGYLYFFMEPEEDTPLKALLKLTLELAKAGELLTK